MLIMWSTLVYDTVSTQHVPVFFFFSFLPFPFHYSCDVRVWKRYSPHTFGTSWWYPVWTSNFVYFYVEQSSANEYILCPRFYCDHVSRSFFLSYPNGIQLKPKSINYKLQRKFTDATLWTYRGNGWRWGGGVREGLRGVFGCVRSELCTLLLYTLPTS